MQTALVAPSHAPPQLVPSSVQAVRDPWGVPVTGLQVPPSPATSHASHCPPQARLQQTPSVQLPLLHWKPRVHATPFARSSSQIDEALQNALPMQSAEVEQLVKQAVPEQR